MHITVQCSAVQCSVVQCDMLSAVCSLAVLMLSDRWVQGSLDKKAPLSLQPVCVMSPLFVFLGIQTHTGWRLGGRKYSRLGKAQTYILSSICSKIVWLVSWSITMVFFSDLEGCLPNERKAWYYKAFSVTYFFHPIDELTDLVPKEILVTQFLF